MTRNRQPLRHRLPSTSADAAVPTAAIDPGAVYRLVGERVRARRTALGMTQASLAKAVGTARTSITNLEKGTQHVPLHVLLAVAGELGAEGADLMPTRAELGIMRGAPGVLEFGEGDMRLVPAKTASAIAALMNRLPPGAR